MMSSVICCVCFVPRAHRPARRDCAVVSRVPAYRSAIRTYRYRIPLRIPRSISNGTVERGPVPRSAVIRRRKHCGILLLVSTGPRLKCTFKCFKTVNAHQLRNP